MIQVKMTEKRERISIIQTANNLGWKMKPILWVKLAEDQAGKDHRGTLQEILNAHRYKGFRLLTGKEKKQNMIKNALQEDLQYSTTKNEHQW